MKTTNLQPWLDYFEMLQQYERQGLLEVKPETHEAFITQPALHAMSEGDDPQQQLRDGSVENTVRRLRAYAACLSAHKQGLSTYNPDIYEDPEAPMPPPIPGKVLYAYLKQVFAVHVVKPDAPHDLLYTILLDRRRRWWMPWKIADSFDVIRYGS